jgi:hypothetical protein
MTNFFSEGFPTLFIITFFGGVALALLEIWFGLKLRKTYKKLTKGQKGRKGID